jgi:hypothetical protein
VHKFIEIADSLFSSFKVDGESVEFSGMGIAHLAADKNKLTKTGRILTTTQGPLL